jgi:hypothetical protein
MNVVQLGPNSLGREFFREKIPAEKNFLAGPA